VSIVDLPAAIAESSKYSHLPSTVYRLRHFMKVSSYCILENTVSRGLKNLDDNGALPQTEKTRSLSVLSGMDNSFLARSAIFGNCCWCWCQNSV